MTSDGLDLSNLSPADAAVALRSYVRRFRELLTDFEPDEDGEGIVRRRPADDKPSPLERAELFAHSIPLGARALDEVLTHDDPVLPTGIIGGLQPEWTAAGADVGSVLDLLAQESEVLARRTAEVPSDQWGRTGHDANGNKVTALDVVREVVRMGHDQLRAAEQAIEAARGR